MPKRGGHRPDGDFQRSYDDHDDRMRKKNRRHVSFKPNTGNFRSNKNFDKHWFESKKLNEDDIVMNDQVIVSDRKHHFPMKGNFRGKGRKDGRVHSPAPRQGFSHKKLIPGASPWYQVIIPYGNKHEKMFLLKSLLTCLSPDIFIPHYYAINGNSAIFYVDDYKMAEKLLNADRKITMPDGFRLSIKVKCGSPQVNVDNNVLEKMKQGMASRYNPATKALDLTKFHTDPALIDTFCPLFRPTIMLAVLNTISENIPDLVALNLNENKLQGIDANIAKMLPNLKILYLANNRIPHINALETIKGLPVEELFLEGNPLAVRFKEKDTYVREVRKRCPKLLKLDGVVLPPVIGFDVPDEVNIPSSQPSFLCNPEGQSIVRQFLEQYFALYDSASRQPLLDAYHESAIFSMSVSYAAGHPQGQNSYNNRLNSYITNSRNLIRVQDREARRKYLKNGRLQIVSFLNDLPKTQHDPQSFTVDLTVYTPTLMMLTVNGLFKELTDCNSSTSNKPPSPLIRAFHKTMIIVPYGSGFCIQNDMLSITNATAAQEQRFLKNSDVTPVVTSVPPPSYTSNPPPPVPMSTPNMTEPPPQMKQQLVQTLAMQTNMNFEWSTNCLEQTHWDLQRALLVFTQLHGKGSIPPEAFVK